MAAGRRLAAGLHAAAVARSVAARRGSRRMSVPDFPLPFALLALARGSSGRAALARLADAALLPHLIDDAGTRRRGVLAWAAAARVVVLSLSDDMLAQDLKPDRITRARFAVRDLLDQAGDARTALVAYAGAAFTVAPLTDDRRTVLNLLRVLRPDVMPVPGNDAAAGIAQAVALLEQAHVQGGEIVLVTDTADAAAIRAARAAHARGIRVDVLGIGTAAGAPVPRSDGGFESEGGQLHLARRDDGALRDVAEAGGGRYAVLQPDGSGVAELGAPAAQAGHASRGERAEVWRDGGAWLLPILLALAALAFRRGWQRRWRCRSRTRRCGNRCGPTATSGRCGPWIAGMRNARRRLRRRPASAVPPNTAPAISPTPRGRSRRAMMHVRATTSATRWRSWATTARRSPLTTRP